MLILVAHGGRSSRWRGSLEALSGAVQEGIPGEEVALAFMQFTGPTLPEVVARGWAAGARRFRVLPLFMASAGHVENDIRPQVEELTERYPEAVFEILPPLGEHPLLPGFLIRITQSIPDSGKS